MKILVVDDDGEACESMRTALSLDGSEVVCASNGEEALKIMETEVFDVLVTDFSMPKVNGIDLATALKENEKTRKVPLFFLYSSSLISRTGREMAGQLGVGLIKNTEQAGIQDEVMARIKETLK